MAANNTPWQNVVQNAHWVYSLGRLAQTAYERVPPLISDGLNQVADNFPKIADYVKDKGGYMGVPDAAENVYGATAGVGVIALRAWKGVRWYNARVQAEQAAHAAQEAAEQAAAQAVAEQQAAQQAAAEAQAQQQATQQALQAAQAQIAQLQQQLQIQEIPDEEVEHFLPELGPD